MPSPYPALPNLSEITEWIGIGFLVDDRHLPILSHETIISVFGDDGTSQIITSIISRLLFNESNSSKERPRKIYAIRQAIAIARGGIIGFANADNNTPVTEPANALRGFEHGHDIVGKRCVEIFRMAFSIVSNTKTKGQ